jgi:hypothetical protein
MNNYQAWLETPGVVRIALVQVLPLVNGSLTPRYLSTHSIAVDSIEYLPVIKGDIVISESISTEYSASISYGDISIANNAGQYDSWLNDIWVNKAIHIYVGSLPAPGTAVSLADFELVFNGLVSDIDSKDRSVLSLKLRDKLEKLNTSISEALLGNYYQGNILDDNSTIYQNQYKNSLKPIVFGEVHNITPLLTDPSLLEYMVNQESVEQIVEVRDNGIPVAFTTIGQGPTIPAGSFRLLSSPSGVITCSVQGVVRTVNISTATTSTTYTNTAANTVATILKHWEPSLGYAEIDATSFSTLGVQAVGVYITDRANALSVCQDIAKDCGLILSVTRSGTVKLVDLTIPTSADITITESDILLNSLNLSSKVPVQAGVKLGYAKNWTIQNNLLTAIPQQHKDMYAVEYLESVQYDSTIKTNYSATVEPELITTYLIDKAEADAVALKVLNLFKQQRKVFSMRCTAKWLSLQVGDSVSLQMSRFNLDLGTLGIVLSTKPNWLRGYIEIEVLV